MQYVQIYDCEGAMQKTYGEAAHKLTATFHFTMLSGGDHHPYDRQGIVETDQFLLFCYIGILVFVFIDYYKFDATY